VTTSPELASRVREPDRGLRSAGPLHVLPNLVLGGVQKSGTTMLHHLLGSHPGIFFPASPQEIHFFDLDENYRRGLGWYAGLFRGWRGEPVVGQTSPLYLYEPRAAVRMRAARLDARFVFILRNPVDRAYSHYWHEVKYGWETLAFADAIEREPARLEQGAEARRHYSYLDRGRYHAQLERFFRHFPRERTLVVLHDDLQRSPDDVARRCAAFLGLPTEGWSPTQNRSIPRNAARRPRVPALQRMTRRFRRSAGPLARLVDRVNLRDVRYPPMDPVLRSELIRLFEPERRALEALLGIDLSEWRGEPVERTDVARAGDGQR